MYAIDSKKRHHSMTDTTTSDEDKYANESFESDVELPDIESDMDVSPPQKLNAMIAFGKRFNDQKNSNTSEIHMPYDSTSEDEDDVIFSQTIAEINTAPMRLEDAMLSGRSYNQRASINGRQITTPTIREEDEYEEEVKEQSEDELTDETEDEEDEEDEEDDELINTEQLLKKQKQDDQDYAFEIDDSESEKGTDDDTANEKLEEEFNDTAYGTSDKEEHEVKSLNMPNFPEFNGSDSKQKGDTQENPLKTEIQKFTELHMCDTDEKTDLTSSQIIESGIGDTDKEQQIDKVTDPDTDNILRASSRDVCDKEFADETKEMNGDFSTGIYSDDQVQFQISSNTPTSLNTDQYVAHMNFMKKDLRLKGPQRKSWSFTNERMREIDRQNQILLRKILTQKPSYPPKSSQPKKFASLPPSKRVTTAAVNRKKQQRQIDLDNQVLKRKIEAISVRRPHL